MNEQALESVLSRLAAAGLVGEANPCGDEYFTVPCPFAPWKHKNGEDNRPSATISFGEGKSVFRCHACGMKGNLEKVLPMLNDLHGGMYAALTNEVLQVEKAAKISIKSRQEKKTAKADHDYMDVLRPMLKTPYPKQLKVFLRKKNVPVEVAKKFYCAYVEEYTFPRKKRDVTAKNALLIPVLARRSEGVICAGAQVRPLDAGKDDLKYFTLFPFTNKANRFFIGEHLFPLARRNNIFIVEGGLDTMHIWSEKHKAFGLMGLYMSPERAKKIKQAAPRRVFILLDPDQNGQETSFKIQEHLKRAGVESEVLFSDTDPKQLTKNDLDQF